MPRWCSTRSGWAIPLIASHQHQIYSAPTADDSMSELLIGVAESSRCAAMIFKPPRDEAAIRPACLGSRSSAL
jgi:hypothetical protein